jgi:hypothetical protein
MVTQRDSRLTRLETITARCADSTLNGHLRHLVTCVTYVCNADSGRLYAAPPRRGRHGLAASHTEPSRVSLCFRGPRRAGGGKQIRCNAFARPPRLTSPYTCRRDTPSSAAAASAASRPTVRCSASCPITPARRTARSHAPQPRSGHHAPLPPGYQPSGAPPLRTRVRN